MEYPVLLKLPLPATCRKLVTWLLREPHPAAQLIRSLDFDREDTIENPKVLPTLYVMGEGVRFIAKETWPPRYWNPAGVVWDGCKIEGMVLTFSYDEVSGDPYEVGY